MKPSLLLVEDDADFRGALVRTLSQQGFDDVVEVASVDEALERLRGHAFDVVLTDLRLGERDGIDLIQSVRQSHPAMRPILMSAYATARDVQVALQQGAVTVLCKPFTADELHAAIQQAAECGTGFHGTFHGISLIDMLQMLHLARRSLKVTMTGAVSGAIHLLEGEIVHAEAGPRRGEEAFRALLGEPAGSLQTAAATEGVERTITRDFQTILMDSLRVLDEQNAGSFEAAGADGGPADPVLKQEGSYEMANVKDALAKIMEIDGCLGACIVDSNSGMMLGSAGGGALNLEVAAAGNTEVVRAKRKTMKSLNLADTIEDILITLGKQYHVIRPVAASDALFIYVALDKQKSNLAMARHQVGAVEKELQIG
ncbi:MAG: response regulator [Vicinamibacteria bacterium]